MKTDVADASGRKTSTSALRSPDRDAVCERCGRPGAQEIAGRRLCIACYDICGSCCLEFGDDDLWRQREEQ